MNRIYFVSHCILNTCSKTIHDMTEDYTLEEERRLAFLRSALENGDAVVQLPCPELMQYGSQRWGHCRTQFDTPFFRTACRDMLAPYIMQLVEYSKHPKRFEELIIVGVNGSPSCGVDFSFDGEGWGGEFSGGIPLNQRLESGYINNKPGIFIEELKLLLRVNNLNIKVISL